MPEAPSIKEALEDLQHFSDTQLDRNPKMQKVVATVVAALATLPPAGERREAIARVFAEAIGCSQECTLATCACLSHADDAILASGLVQDEAGWRDISTAPKDGTEILLFTHHEADEYLDESFDAVQIGWWDDGNHAPGSAFHRDAGWHQQKIGSATHWMPLPTPPIRSARDGGAET